ERRKDVTRRGRERVDVRADLGPERAAATELIRRLTHADLDHVAPYLDRVDAGVLLIERRRLVRGGDGEFLLLEEVASREQNDGGGEDQGLRVHLVKLQSGQVSGVRFREWVITR